VAARCFHVGQPVIVGGHTRDIPDAIIRIALGGAMITDIASVKSTSGDIEHDLTELDRSLQDLCRKLELIAEFHTLLESTL
jgi:hypothetical protein